MIYGKCFAPPKSDSCMLDIQVTVLGEREVQRWLKDFIFCPLGTNWEHWW